MLIHLVSDSKILKIRPGKTSPMSLSIVSMFFISDRAIATGLDNKTPENRVATYLGRFLRLCKHFK